MVRSSVILLEILAGLGAALITIVMAPPAILLFPLAPYSRPATFYIRTWARLLLRVAGVRYVVSGAGQLGRDRRVLLLSNHLSYYDIPAILAAVPLPLRMVAKKELFLVPFLGWGMRAAKFIPIDRLDHKKALKSIELAAERIRTGTPVLLFPEGTRSRDGKLGSFKKGSFALAMKAQVPVYPVVVKGSDAVHERKRAWKLGIGKTVTVEILEPLDPAAFAESGAAGLMAETRRRIAERLGEPA